MSIEECADALNMPKENETDLRFDDNGEEQDGNDTTNNEPSALCGKYECKD